MNKIIMLVLASLILFNTSAKAFEDKKIHMPTYKEQKQTDKMFETRLNLTENQIKYLKENKQKTKKEMQKTISRMENLHKKIKNIYLLGIPKYQADLRTAPYKAELALLAQNLKKQKIERRKNFESILTKEQRVEFEKIKAEFKEKRYSNKIKE